ncbi:phosphotransferase [Companilactobacillus alimentarius]|uniref:Aminoglycoside phosphotransferase domain-containing protein n=1 Tax=Companilactobacillus alimentarius DSM 20249 TaxID=1423720 RepID=A0A2K9HFS4_9LACO|nr:phosphotransferase [Companilactobacillus alimentarius]AUI71228.1 hypothetical protein LA20249_03020 [Companilactobacillus alimentarius DSM 20249]KRK75364.1 hypothetical protein FC67_GL001880 [Companilactobacillus alimentarius DSM 20249]GEO43852.1 hypothetical protein LAL01_00840 [Companilactobacillus alimentarius]
MLNQSVLTSDKIKLLLENNYGIFDIDKISVINRGSAGIYKILMKNRFEYIVKEFQSGYSEKSIKNEVGICDFLMKKGIHTSELLRDNKGNTVNKINGRFVTVQKYIQGYTVNPNEAPLWLMNESSMLLGKIHVKLSNYPMKRYGFKSNWLNLDIKNKKGKRFEEYIKKAEKDSNSNSEEIINDLKFKLSLIKEIPNSFDKSSLTYVNSHGDYSINQLICNDDHITAVIDFATASKLPAVWEVIRSFTYSDPDCKNGKINIFSLEAYIEAYLTYGTLTHSDIERMFDIYYYQLILSSYGYKEYFEKETYRRENVINFAKWRTNLLRDLCKNKEDYGYQLNNWFLKKRV